MSEWARLTPGAEDRIDIVMGHRAIYTNDSYCLASSYQKGGQLGETYLCTVVVSIEELANIPWVRTLIESSRREVQHKEGIHEKATVEYDNENGAVDDAIDKILPAREDDECLDGVIAALKPFEDVVYE